MDFLALAPSLFSPLAGWQIPFSLLLNCNMQSSIHALILSRAALSEPRCSRFRAAQ